jgi:hypothetical protein
MSSIPTSIIWISTWCPNPDQVVKSSLSWSNQTRSSTTSSMYLR